MKTNVKTYRATVAGKACRVTVPPNDPADPAKELRDLIQDCISPPAAAAIADAVLARLDERDWTKDVASQMRWFANQLIDALGRGRGYKTALREALE